MKRRTFLKGVGAAAFSTTASRNIDVLGLIGSVTRDSFYQFVRRFWHVAITREPVWNWHIKYLCDELQRMAERVFADQPKEYDLVINVPPGSTKSSIASIFFEAWCWTRMPEIQFITASYAFNLAMDLSRRTRDIIRSPYYQSIFDVELRSDQAVKSHYMNTRGGFRIAVGTGGVTGFHGHFIVVDDPIDPNEAGSVSEASLKAANLWMSEVLSQRKIDKRITPTILIMQRLHQNDPTAHMLETASDENVNIKHICLPAEDGDNVKPVECRKYYVDGLLDPVRLDRKTLKENYVKLGEYGYAGQFMQDPKPRGGGMFKTDRLVFEKVPPTKFKQKVRYWDKAGTHKAGCYTVGALLGETVEGRIWILDIVRGQWEMNERERKIKQTAQIDGRMVRVRVEQEPGSGGKDSAEYTIRNLRGFLVSADKVGQAEGNKIMRAEGFADQVNGGNVSVVIAPWNRELVNELDYFPASKYKDQTDACSGAFNTICRPRTRVGAF